MDHDEIPQQSILVSDNQGNVVVLESVHMPDGAIHLLMSTNTDINTNAIAALLVNYASELVEATYFRNRLAEVRDAIVLECSIEHYSPSKKGGPPPWTHPF